MKALWRYDRPMKTENTKSWQVWFFTVVGIPLVLSDWMPLSTQIKGSPKVKVEGSTLSITTEGEAGGFAYFLEKPISISGNNFDVNWKWQVSQFPDVIPTIPFKKSEEDFALRVGMLLSDGTSRIPLPGNFGKEFEKRKQALSYVLFYCASQNRAKRQCGRSPYHRNIVNCLNPAGKKQNSVMVTPFKDIKQFLGKRPETKKLEVVGVWLFADSDNSRSRSNAMVSDIKLYIRK